MLEVRLSPLHFTANIFFNHVKIGPTPLFEADRQTDRQTDRLACYIFVLPNYTFRIQVS
jgi:hypothetical protein